MSNLSDFMAGRATKAITNAFSSGTPARVALGINNSARKVLSGALTAGTLKTLLSITGPCRLPYLVAAVEDSTSRSLRLRVTVDGVVAFDATSSAALSNAGYGLVAAATDSQHQSGEIVANASVLVEVASSLSETDKLSISYVAITH